MVGEHMNNDNNEISVTMAEILEDIQLENSSLRLELLVSKRMITKLQQALQGSGNRIEEIPKEEVQVLLPRLGGD